jgi:MoaA/NifB/PqqE/SkfB family radical SAM enzyme
MLNLNRVRKIPKAINTAWPLVKSRILGRKIPLLLLLITTQRCNMSCGYCWASVRNSNDREWSFEDITRIIDQFYRIGTRIVWLQGGEPLLRKDIGAIIAYIKKKKMFCEVITNGWLGEQRMDVLLMADSVCVSIDGDENTHDRIRGKGSHARIIRTLEVGKRRGLNFRLNAVLGKHNMNRETVDYLCHLAERMGTVVSFPFAQIPLQKQKVGEDMSSFEFDDEELRSIQHYLIKLKREGRPLNHSIGSLRRSINWPLSYQEIGFSHNINRKQVPCYYGRYVGILDNDGMLYPCTRFFGDPERGASIHQLGARKAWEKVSQLDCVACGRLSEMHRVLSVNPFRIFEILRKKLL